MFFGSTIMTFALPYGAFIAAAIALFYLFRARHSGPRLRWSAGSDATISSVTTWEPGPAPAPAVVQTDLASELASAAAAVPGQADLGAEPTTADAPTDPTDPTDPTATNETVADPAEGKGGEGE
jgi:hypothetical protein